MIRDQVRLIVLDLVMVAALMVFVVGAVKVATLPTVTGPVTPAPAKVEAKCRCTFCPTHRNIDLGDLPRR